MLYTSITKPYKSAEYNVTASKKVDRKVQGPWWGTLGDYDCYSQFFLQEFLWMLDPV